MQSVVYYSIAVLLHLIRTHKQQLCIQFPISLYCRLELNECISPFVLQHRERLVMLMLQEDNKKMLLTSLVVPDPKDGKATLYLASLSGIRSTLNSIVF